MRTPILAVLALVLAAPGARAQDEPLPPDLPEGVRDVHAREVSSSEVRVPLRGQYFRTPGRLRLGDFEVSVFASELVTADDNISLTERDTESDVILATSLGTRLTTEGARTRVDLTAAVSHDAYLRNSGEDSFGGALDLSARYGADRGFFAQLGERFLARNTPVTTSLSAPGSPVIAVGSRIARTRQSDTALTLGTRGEKSSFEARYEHSLTSNGRPLDGLNGVEHVVTLKAGREPSPKTEVSLQAEGRAARFEEDLTNDSDSLALFAGARWDATPKTSLGGRIGVQSQSVSSNGAAADDAEFRGAVGSLDVLHEAGPRLFVDGLVSRGTFPSIGSNYQLVQIVGTGARWEFRDDWLARAGLSWQDSRNSAGPDGDFYTVELGVSWQASDRWTTALTYRYQQFRGNVAGIDYVDNRIGLQVSVNF